MFRPKILNNSIQGPCDIGTSFKNIFAFYRKKMCVIVNYVNVWRIQTTVDKSKLRIELSRIFKEVSRLFSSIGLDEWHVAWFSELIV